MSLVARRVRNEIDNDWRCALSTRDLFSRVQSKSLLIRELCECFRMDFGRDESGRRRSDDQHWISGALKSLPEPALW